MSQPNSPFKLLFIPVCSQGHMNYCATIANRLLSYDNTEVHFALTQEFIDRFSKIVPKANYHSYVSYIGDVPKEEEANDPSKRLVQIMNDFGPTWSSDCLKTIQVSAPIILGIFNSTRASYDDLNAIVEQVQPNFIIFDQLFSIPVGKKSIPWANLSSTAMPFFGLPKLPAPQSGLPTKYTPENEAKWNHFIEQAYRSGAWAQLNKAVSEHLVEKGVAPLPDDCYMCLETSPYLNIYAYPQELDFFHEDPSLKPAGNWMRIDSPIVGPAPAPYPIPERLKNKPGKLVYFSLGSMATAYKPLMIKMIEILSELPHRFILSKGVLGHEFDSIMGDNLDGEPFINQLAVLQSVSMIISHGGNNTLTESFHFGVPLIVMPLFGDQPDNAQRVHEMGYGRRLSIFDEKEKLKRDLLEAIEFCSSEPVVRRMKSASERIQKDTGLDRVCEELLKYKQ